MPDDFEVARLQAVERAVKQTLATPGHITRAEITAALAAQPEPVADPFTPTFEERF